MSQETAASSLPPATSKSSMELQTEDEYEQLKRFQIELEFVQCLANPWYLHHLAQQQYFNQDSFARYLDYLQYFRKPEYAKFIIYPHCLHFLTLLQHKSFRDHLAKQDTATFVHERQYYHWQYLRNQDKVVRMEIMPDGSLVEIKNEQDAVVARPVTPSQSQPQPQPQVQSHGLTQMQTNITGSAPSDGSSDQQRSNATTPGAAATPGARPNGSSSI